MSAPGFTTPVPVRWSDIDMYQHVNHATMVTILEEARVPFLKEPFGAEITTVGLLIARGAGALQRPAAAGRFAAAGHHLEQTGARGRLHAGLRGAARQRRPERKPSVIAETQLAAVHIKEQRLQRLSPAQREYLQRWMR